MAIKVFSGKPSTGLNAWLHRGAADESCLSAVLKVVAITWLPLAILSAARGDFLAGAHAGAFLSDYAVHARSLLAIALLVIANSVCLPRLDAIARQFPESDLILDSDRGRFDAAWQSTGSLNNAHWPQVVIWCSALALSAALVWHAIPRLPHWHLRQTSTMLSAAGWWHVLVSLPILLALQLEWVWKLILWWRLLWLVSNLSLHLLPAHPDRSGGLLFAGYSTRAWAIVASVPGVIASGTLANRIVHDGQSPLAYKYLVIGMTVFIMMLMIAPLCVFSKNLLNCWRKGVLEYGALAEQVGHAFEAAWLRRRGHFTESPLETGAFSATTDLYQIVSNVYQLRPLPVDAQSIVFLGVVTALPFLPLLLIAQPLDVMLKELMSFLL